MNISSNVRKANYLNGLCVELVITNDLIIMPYITVETTVTILRESTQIF